MKAINRFYQYIEYKEIKPTRFEKDFGLSNGYLGTQLRREADLGEGVLNTIVDNCLDLDPEWLLTGKGKMLKSAYQQDDNIIHAKSSDVSYGSVGETRPRIPLSASAGTLSMALEGGGLYDCEQVAVIKSLPYYDFTIVTHGDSMEPLLYGGDELACLLIKDKFSIQWGRVHALDTANGIVIKRIYDSGEYFSCHSENKELYKEFNVHKSNVYNLSLVIGFLRRF